MCLFVNTITIGVNSNSLVRGLGERKSWGQGPPEAESFLRIGHPKEEANWPHVRVLNDRNCNFRERALWGGEGTIWGAPEATNIRLLYAKGIKLIPPSNNELIHCWIRTKLVV